LTFSKSLFKECPHTIQPKIDPHPYCWHPVHVLLQLVYTKSSWWHICLHCLATNTLKGGMLLHSFLGSNVKCWYGEHNCLWNCH
jgi:hypothetical protein